MRDIYRELARCRKGEARERRGEVKELRKELTNIEKKALKEILGRADVVLGSAESALLHPQDLTPCCCSLTKPAGGIMTSRRGMESLAERSC